MGETGGVEAPVHMGAVMSKGHREASVQYPLASWSSAVLTVGIGDHAAVVAVVSPCRSPRPPTTASSTVASGLGFLAAR